MGGGLTQQQVQQAQSAEPQQPSIDEAVLHDQANVVSANETEVAEDEQQVVADLSEALADARAHAHEPEEQEHTQDQARQQQPELQATHINPVVAEEPASSPAVPQVASSASTTTDATVAVTPYLEFQEVNAHEARSVSCVVTLEASAHEPDERTPLDVVCVIDVSGSMQGTKLDNAKKTLDFVIKQLRPSDRMALVTYDSEVTVVFGMTTMSGDRKDMCREECRKLKSGSCTNLSGGLLQGLQVLRDLGDRRPVSSVLLMTDGIANEGIQGTTDIVAAMRAAKDGLPTTSVYTFGYGADHNTDLLKNISEAGSGMYYYIENIDSIPQCFADCLGGLLSTIAQNIAITIKAAPNHTIKQVHSQRPFTLSADGASCVVQMGDIQSEETRDLLFEVGIPASLEPHDAEAIANVEVSFLNVVQAKFETKRCTFDLSRPLIASHQAKVTKVEQQKNRVRVAQTIEQARAHADRREYAVAQEALQRVMADLQSSPDLYAKELVDDLRQCAATVGSREQYAAGGAQMLSNICQSHQYQRSNQPAHTRGYVSYTTTVKGRFRDAAM